MYINFDLLEKESFEWKNNELLVIFCIRQKEYERLDNCSESLNKLFQRKLYQSKLYLSKLCSSKLYSRKLYQSILYYKKIY